MSLQLKYSNSDRNFKEIPMSPEAMDDFFTIDNALWKITNAYSERCIKNEKKIEEVKTAMTACLTQRQLEVISLYYFKGKNQSDIGVILGIHQTTVSQHLIYGIRKLKKALN